ncbi:hypothetical protein M569_08962 [Genlisea aurea]|uniref:Transmembrane protein 14 n=1 Tax=Genlisea aurea TaxID=192259 RepID=S8CFX9_9LAMI|nr:hypothetical protein M569_08962 [Genlisea aurea]
MGELLGLSQSSSLLLLRSPRRGKCPVGSSMAKTLNYSISSRKTNFPTSYCRSNIASWMTRASSFVSDSKVPTTFSVDSPGKGIDILPDSGGSDDKFKSDDHHKDNHRNQKAISMSQKFTLGYAALVGIGGLLGFLKGGSKKSLIAGGVSASLLYYIHTLLPSNPVVASSLGLAVSASLLGVMGSRFKKSGKIFPAGVVSGASLVMTGGYLHGILRSLH